MLALLLVGASCTAGPETEPSTAGSTAGSTDALRGSSTAGAKPDDAAAAAGSAAEPPRGECDGIGPPPASATLTYLSNSTLFEAQPDGSAARCLVRAARPLTLAWSPNGDQVLLGGLQTYLQQGQREVVAEQVVSPRWSRPTGKSTVHISIDHRRLLKVPAAGGAPVDISFLDRHDEVVYHPAGTHIAVVGRTNDGAYGIFLAGNDGKNPQPIARAETASTVSSLAFDESGDFLYFSAEHDGEHHLHRLANRSSGEDVLETLKAGPEPVGRIFPSPTDPRAVAFRSGDCGEARTRTVVGQVKPSGEVQFVDVPSITRFMEPAGWLPDGGLLVIARPINCDQPGDLYVWAGQGSKLVARNVDRAAVRATAQAPPPPPPVPGAGVA